MSYLRRACWLADVIGRLLHSSRRQSAARPRDGTVTPVSIATNRAGKPIRAGAGLNRTCSARAGEASPVVPERGVVIEGDLGIERDHPAVAGEQQRARVSASSVVDAATIMPSAD
jgi:hypothetical protein